MCVVDDALTEAMWNNNVYEHFVAFCYRPHISNIIY